MNRNTDDLIESILRRQNKDGGWAYQRGASWTEPSFYAALVLKACSADRTAFLRAIKWIGGRQRPDGGFSPYGPVEQSTWVTSLMLLFSPEDFAGRYQSALRWVLRQTGQETGWLSRVRLRVLPREDAGAVMGWPWFPGTASWVSPTSTALVGLRHAQLYSSDPAIAARIEEGERYLIAHQCQGGGWNHGSERALGYSSESYPETTGIALLALRGFSRNPLSASLDRARSLAQECTFSEGLSWLRMGLAAHGEILSPLPVFPKPRNVRDECLQVLSEKLGSGPVKL